MVHSEADYEAAVEASNILFGNSTSEQLHKLDEDTLLAVFEGVPQFEISRNTVLAGIPAVELTTEVAAIFPSKRRNAEADTRRRRIHQQRETRRSRHEDRCNLPIEQ